MQSKNGLKDLLEDNMDGDPLYPIIHLEGDISTLPMVEPMARLLFICLAIATRRYASKCI